MTDYKSALESLAPCKELLFNGTPGFGRYASLLSHSVAHPAKMNTRLTEYLILELTKPGELVLDPMSGTGQTGIVAVLNSRDAVCVELEDTFHNWQLEAKGKLAVTQTFVAKGSLSCLQGDARKLSSLLPMADVILTSPPYAETVISGGNEERRQERLIKAGYNTKDYFGGKARNSTLKPYDAIITSPPYEKTIKDHGTSERATKINKEKHNLSSWAYNAKNPDNIGNMGKDAYFDEMQKVYAEMFKVLKPGGVAAVIVKPFIRNRAVMDLPFQTWMLMQRCGFQLIKVYKQRLDQQSFWRILYMQKNPEVPQIWHEWVLVCKKSQFISSEVKNTP